MGIFNITSMVVDTSKKTAFYYAVFLFVGLVSPSAQQLPHQLQSFKLERRNMERRFGDLDEVLPLLFDLQYDLLKEDVQVQGSAPLELNEGDQYWPVKRSIGTGPDHGCVCPSPASEQRVQRGSNMDQMEADGDGANTDTSLQMLMMLQQMRDKIDRQISVKHGRDITTPAGFSRLSPFRPSGNTQQWREIMKNIG